MLKEKLNLFLMLIIFILSLITISMFNKTEEVKETKTEPQEQEILVKVKITSTNEIKELPLEEYIIGVIAAEMPASFHEEALKAQAIASRSYVVSKLNLNDNYDVVDTVSNQAFIEEEAMKKKWGEDYEKYYNKISDAVLKTKNLIVTHNNEIITTYYFAMSNGKTENSELVFQEEKPYLKSVESKWDNESLNNYISTTTISKEEFCQKLTIDCTNITVNILARYESNRIDKLQINNKELTGVEFRNIFQIRSTDFEININENVEITTKGYGHGVGMSQYGANGMAQEGYTYEKIIKYYYQETEIKNLKDV